jgi:hypothetical protein
MTTPTHTILRLAIVGAALAAAALTPPFAAADPSTVSLPLPASSAPHLGDQLSGHDRNRLTSSSQGKELDLGTLDPLVADAIRASRARALNFGALDPLIADAIRADRAQRRNSEDRSVARSAAGQQNARTSFANDGFRWSDAGVGAGSMLALVLLGGGTAALAYRHRRRPRAQQGS